MLVAILGPLEVHDDRGTRLDIGGARLRALLIRLALEPGRAVGVAALVDAVWGEDPPAEAGNALQTLVSRLRRALGAADAIVAAPHGYRLAVEPADVDACRFAELAEAGAGALRAGDDETAGRTLHAALALWREPALADVPDSLQAQATRLSQQRLGAHVDRIDADLRTGRTTGVVAELEELADRHPLDERVAGLLVKALAGVGRQADALQVYERVRVRLADELGVDPSSELQQVHLAALRGELGAPGAAEPVAAARRTNLRAQLTSFVGRDDEVARIAKSLENSRLVTLVGPGGAGKTRLATEAGQQVLDAVPDGVWFVELAPVTTGSDVAGAVLNSLGLREITVREIRTPTEARDAQRVLLDGLGDRRLLLVLDNCEHLIEATAQLADVLLAHCPDLRILATSREPFGIVGEVLLAVPPLGQPAADASASEALAYPAVRLFADRAAAVRPDFEIDEGIVATVIEIVRRLDGMPLAIELAAARLRSMPPQEIATRLSSRFRLLTGGSRTALPRHRTLRAVVEWSWDLLGPDERQLAEQLAVFPAGVTTDSAAAVSQLDEFDVAEVLASLADKSLLQPVEGGRRMRMLETIREYGAERLAERGELAGVRARHATYFAAVMAEAEPQLIGADQLRWFDAVTADRDNILAALRYLGDAGDTDGALHVARGLAVYAMIIGANAELAGWLEEALAFPAGSDTDLRTLLEGLHAINSAASGAHTTNGSNRFRHDLGELARRMGGIDADYSPFVSLVRIVLAFFADDPALATRYTAPGMAGRDPWAQAASLMFAANMGENEGDLDRMRVNTVAALERFRALGERWGLANSLRGLGQLRTLEGDIDGAIDAYREAMSLTTELSSHDDEGFVMGRLADLELRRGDLDAARAYVHDAQRRAEQHGEPMEAVFTTAMLGAVEHAAGNRAAAARLQREAADRMRELPPGHPALGHLRALVLAVSARLQAEDGDVAGATAMGHDAFEAARGTRDLPILASVGVTLAYIAAQTGEPRSAADLLGAAARLRGADDWTARDIADLADRLRAELGVDEFARRYEQAKTLDRDAAIERLRPRPV